MILRPGVLDQVEGVWQWSWRSAWPRGDPKRGPTPALGSTAMLVHLGASVGKKAKKASIPVSSMSSCPALKEFWVQMVEFEKRS